MAASEAISSPQRTVSITSAPKIFVSHFSDVLIDEHHSFSFQEISADSTQDRYQPLTRLTDTRAAYWIRFRLENPDSIPQRRYFLVGNVLLDTGILYRSIIRRNSVEVAHPSWDSSLGGSSIEFAKRNVPLKGIWHNITIQPHTTELIYLHIIARNGLSVELSLQDEEEFRLYRDSVLTFYSFILGITFFAMVYNFVIALSTKDKAYKYYSVNAAIWFLGGLFTFFPILEQQFPHVIHLSTKLQLAILVLGGMGTTVFAIHFLNIRQYSPSVYRFMVWSLAYQTCAMIILTTPFYTFVSPMLNIAFIPGAVALILAAIRAWRQGYTPARLYLLGWGLYLTSIIIAILTLVGVFEYSEFNSARLVWLGVGIETIVFSFALAERINLVRDSLAKEQEQRIILERAREIERDKAQAMEFSNYELSRQNDIVRRQAASIQQANVMLMEQNQRLEELNREKNEILAIVSHDMKNPLAALRGIVELLQSGGNSATFAKSALLQMQGTIDKMLVMVKNLLDVNRLETGALEYSLSPVDVNQIIAKSVEQFTKPGEAKGIHIVSERLEDSELRTFADEQALSQVIDNLLSNSIKYSPYRSHVTISAFAYQSDKAEITMLTAHNLKRYDMLMEKCIVIAVRDQGPGISPKDHEKLFGKFTRLSAQPTGGEHSTGLGLSIVKKLVEGMNGRVWCESDFGYGATFFVALPVFSSR